MDRNLSKEFEKIRIEQHEDIYQDNQIPLKEKIVIHESNPKLYQNVNNYDNFNILNENDINKITPQK